jgi:type I restriction enzyme S subunit
MSNSLPSGWESTTVGELASVKRGASPRPIQDPNWWGGSVGWIRISDVTSSRKYLTKTTQYLSEAGVKKSVQIKQGEVVLSICATIGRPIIVKVDACIHDGFVWFDKLRSNIDREFWYYFLLSKEEFLSSQRQSGTQGNLNTGIVSDLTCFIPPIKEQQKIASILTVVDEVIESTTAQINKLKDLKTGMMQELLTKGIGHTEFKDSPVGRIPKAWEVHALGKNASLIPGYAFGSEDFVAQGVPLIRMGNLYQNQLNLNRAAVSLPAQFLDVHKKFIVSEGDIVFSMTGTVGKEDYGFAVRLPPKSPKCLLNQRVAKISNGERIDNGFLLYLLQSRLFLNEIYAIGKGTKQANLSSMNILSIELPLPPISEQRKIAAMLEAISERIASLVEKNFRNDFLKKSLMQELLTGSTRVKVM